ncbi:MAG: hypothetical protein ABIQ06_13180 [Caldimonas sp.]
MSTQGLTYPHDFDPSQISAGVLRRIIPEFLGARKSLISLSSFACRESGQGVGKRATASLSAPPRALFHKVTHSSGGKSQKPRRIMNLERVVEAHGKFVGSAAQAC